MDLEFFMNEAYKEAEKAFSLGEVPIGAVIVKDGQIISKAYNFVENSNISVNHAEIRAIKEANLFLGDWRLDNCVIFTTLEPCLMCRGAILQSRISKVYFGARDRGILDFNRSEKLRNNKYNFEVEIQGGILEEKCSNLIDKFFKSRREENRR